ncbi:MAG: FAD-binding oxidoreductase [Rhodobacteraceae bacterium]|nr:FAD-binding oxidoreductase [Paracoccaceae bacterium]
MEKGGLAAMVGFDFIVIGAGIAGASVAAELAGSGRVVLLEMESQPGYHTTGRSAAIFAPVYGPAPIRALTRASEAFFHDPPEGFTDHALFSPRATLLIAREDQGPVLDAMMAELRDDPTVERLDAEQAHEVQPMLRDGYAVGAVFDQKGQDIDVHALHHGYLGMFRRAGGVLVCKAEVNSLQCQAGVWQVEAGGESYRAPVVVNAAGAWADRIGAMACAEIIGLVPKRRTALMIKAPDGIKTGDMPITVDIDEQFYLKPDAGRLLISPANEDVDVPGDVQPDEMDVAICIDRIERAFDLDVRRIENKWAGLRSFVADGVPVVGMSDRVDGFLWLAGQGGYGIQSAPALSRLAAAMVLGAAVPVDIQDQGLNPDDLAPARLEMTP